MKRFFMTFAAMLLMSVSAFAQSNEPLKGHNGLQQGSSFKESAVYYRMPTYVGTDTEAKYLGNVEVTIKQERSGFRLYAINNQVVKIDPQRGIDLNNNQTGQVHETSFSDNYMYEAHWRKNGISYIVLFNSIRIRDYYISH